MGKAAPLRRRAPDRVRVLRSILGLRLLLRPVLLRSVLLRQLLSSVRVPAIRAVRFGRRAHPVSVLWHLWRASLHSRPPEGGVRDRGLCAGRPARGARSTRPAAPPPPYSRPVYPNRGGPEGEPAPVGGPA